MSKADFNAKINEITAIRVEDAKGNKERYTILSVALLKDLRAYFWSSAQRNSCLMEFTETSIQRVVKRASKWEE